MPSDVKSSVAASILGLLAVVFIGLLGAAAILVAMGYGAPGWLIDGYLVVTLGAIAFYTAVAFLPQRRLEALQAASREDRARLETRFLAALERVRGGDLTSGPDALHGVSQQLASAFTLAARALGSLIEQIQNSSIEVAAAGGGIQTTASELASGSSQQAAAVVEITASMEELARTAGQIAYNASNQASLAAQAETGGNAGADAVDEALRGVEEVQQRISMIASRADTLGSRSKEIYRVLDLITDIAQETHILSLNAAIEASAAGEHGRRFSVVADEVRRLAKRSRESVESVRVLLDEFAGSIRATVVATEEGGKEVVRVLERARAAAAAIEELRGALANTARVAREISMATQQQQGASDQVVLTLKEVSQVIQRMAEGLRHFSGTAERLNQLALSIQLLTQSFHLESPHSLKHLAGGWTEKLAYRAGHWDALAPQLDEIVAASPFVELVYVVDAKGNMVAFALGRSGAPREASASVSIGSNFADRPWFQAVTRDGRKILTPLYDSLLTGEKCFTVAAPIRDAQGALAGVLGVDVNVLSWTRI
jgi:methyl-accepting chemotaxis protein